MTKTSAATMLADRALIRVSGEDAREFLQGLVTQDVIGLDPSAPRWGALLTPQGKALFDFILWDDGGAILIDCEAARRVALVRRLSIYRLRRAIAIEPVEGAVHWAPETDDPAVFPIDAARDPRLPALGRRWLGAPGAATTDWTRHRLSYGVTEGVAELGDGETLWLECNADLLNGVSFSKGCYVGQENTARMHHRSKVNRRLVVAPIGLPGDRTRIAYPDLALMVELRRLDALGNALVPDWMVSALD